MQSTTSRFPTGLGPSAWAASCTFTVHRNSNIHTRSTPAHRPFHTLVCNYPRGTHANLSSAEGYCARVQLRASVASRFVQRIVNCQRTCAKTNCEAVIRIGFSRHEYAIPQRVRNGSGIGKEWLVQSVLACDLPYGDPRSEPEWRQTVRAKSGIHDDFEDIPSNPTSLTGSHKFPSSLWTLHFPI